MLFEFGIKGHTFVIRCCVMIVIEVGGVSAVLQFDSWRCGRRPGGPCRLVGDIGRVGQRGRQVWM